MIHETEFVTKKDVQNYNSQKQLPKVIYDVRYRYINRGTTTTVYFRDHHCYIFHVQVQPLNKLEKIGTEKAKIHKQNQYNT